jgi:hypothetical protein
MTTDVNFQGTCPKCGEVTYMLGQEDLRQSLHNGSPITLLCFTCNGKRSARASERERLARILERQDP